MRVNAPCGATTRSIRSLILTPPFRTEPGGKSRAKIGYTTGTSSAQASEDVHGLRSLNRGRKSPRFASGWHSRPCAGLRRSIRWNRTRRSCMWSLSGPNACPPVRNYSSQGKPRSTRRRLPLRARCTSRLTAPRSRSCSKPFPRHCLRDQYYRIRRGPPGRHPPRQQRTPARRLSSSLCLVACCFWFFCISSQPAPASISTCPPPPKGAKLSSETWKNESGASGIDWPG